MGLGLRPSEIAALKIGNFHQDHRGYALDVQKTPGRLPKKRYLLPDIGKVLEHHVKQIVDWYRQASVPKGKWLPEADLPIFPAPNDDSDSYDYTRPQTATAIWAELKKVSARLKLPSSLGLDPARFRRTIAAMAAYQSYSSRVIAEMLGPHYGDVPQYVQATPDIVRKIDEALDSKFSKIAKAFKCRIVKSGKKDKE